MYGVTCSAPLACSLPVRNGSIYRLLIFSLFECACFMCAHPCCYHFTHSKSFTIAQAARNKFELNDFCCRKAVSCNIFIHVHSCYILLSLLHSKRPCCHFNETILCAMMIFTFLIFITLANGTLLSFRLLSHTHIHSSTWVWYLLCCACVLTCTGTDNSVDVPT